MNGRVVLAFDKFKGTFSALEVCQSAEKGLVSRGLHPGSVDMCPLSDGGDGFLDCLARSSNMEKRWHPGATGADFVPIRVAYLVSEDGTAYVESAKIFGLADLPPHKRNPLRTTTFGLGELLKHLVEEGVGRVVIGLGGTATNDGGVGMLTALGWRFLDAEGKAILPVGGMLEDIQHIEPGPTLPLQVVAATDVWNPLYGPNGAAKVFATQKGADAEGVTRLDRGLRHLASQFHRIHSHDAARKPGSGAAGGLGYGLTQALGAQIVSGAEVALNASRFNERLIGAHACFTGEGRADRQTLQGKLPDVVLKACQTASVPCFLACGQLEIDPKKAGFVDGMAADRSGTGTATGPDIADAVAELWDRHMFGTGA